MDLAIDVLFWFVHYLFGIFNSNPQFWEKFQPVLWPQSSNVPPLWAVMYMCVRDIEFAYFYDFSIECLELIRHCDIFFHFIIVKKELWWCTSNRASKRNIARRNITALRPEDRLKLLSKLWIWVENTNLKRPSTLNDSLAVVLAAGIFNKKHNIVSIEG
jgi:hypothetical protein